MAYQLRPGFLFNKLGIPGLSERAYSTKVRAIAPANLIAYWRLHEKTGTNAVNLEGTAARDGTYTGVTLNSATGPGGQPVGLWDGAADYCDIYSASFNTAWDGNEGTMALWCKVSAAGVWTDGDVRRLIKIGVDESENRIYIRKNSVNNQILFLREGGNDGPEQITKAAVSTTDWFHIALTWSDSGDKVIAYYNGAQTGAAQVGVGTWAGVLSASYCTIGARNTTPVEVWDGYLAHAAIWTTPLTPAQIASLAVV